GTPTNLVAVHIAATVIAGARWPNGEWANSNDVAWLTARLRIKASLHDQFMAAGGVMHQDEDQFRRVQLLEATKDRVRVAMHHLADALGQLEEVLQTANDIRLVIADYLFPYIASGDLEENINGLGQAIYALNHIAVNHGLAVVVPCSLAYRGGRNEITQAVGWFMDNPQLQSILLLEGSDRGTLSSKKTPPGAQPPIVNFLRAKGTCYSSMSVPMVVFERTSNKFDVNRW